MNTLIIQWLLKPNDTCNLMLWDDQQQIIWQESGVDIKSIATLVKSNAPSKHSRIIVLLPGQWVTISEVQLPKRISNKQREKMIGFAIEEELIEEPSSLHFVLSPPKALAKDEKSSKSSKTQIYPVAIISHEKMTAVTAALEKQNIFPDTITPDYLAIEAPHKEPGSEDGDSDYNVSIINDEALIRTGMAQGYSIDSRQLPWFCQQLYMQHTTDDKPLSASIHLNSDAADLPWEWPDDLIATMPLEVAMECSLEECWSFAAMIKQPLNLLSGKYRGRGKYRQKGDKTKTGIWRKCAYAAALFLVVAFASKGARYNILSVENKAYMQQVSSEVKRYSPKTDTSSLSNIKKQVQLLLMEIKKLDGHNQLLKQLITLDDFFSIHPQTKILSLDHKANSWQMVLQTKDQNQLKNITSSLNKANWSASQQIASEKVKKSFDYLLQDKKDKDEDKNAVIAILTISPKQATKIKKT